MSEMGEHEHLWSQCPHGSVCYNPSCKRPLFVTGMCNDCERELDDSICANIAYDEEK